MTLGEWRDVGLIAIAAGFGVFSLVWLVVVLVAARVGFRVIRALRRVHDERLLGALASAEQRQAAWREEGLLGARGLVELVRRGAALRSRRRAKPKRRLWGLLPPAR